jgi:hypothetical protein
MAVAVAEKVMAGLVLAVCLVLLVRIFLGTRLRYRLDRSAVALWHRLQRGIGRLARRRRSRAPSPEDAVKAADEAIRRAQEGSWRGNVYTPKSFRKPRKPH